MREAKAWSQAQLARKMNVQQSCVSKWERSMTLPDAEQIVELTKLFDVSSDFLLGIKDDYL